MDESALILPTGAEKRLDAAVAIGREDDNELVLEHPTVSRHHAALSPRNGSWYVTDLGSFNGTFLNDDRVPPGIALRLRHGDRIALGSEVLVFSAPAQQSDPERTETLVEAGEIVGQLSPFQRQVVQCLCSGWLAGGSLDELPSNEEIAARLGTPGAVGAVKAALRRSYAKAGLTTGPVYVKRRTLCRIARKQDWI